MKNITKAFIEKLKKNPVPILDTLTEDDIVRLIQRANHAYYNDTPLFSDNLFDIIKEYLETKNPDNPILKNVGSIAESGKKEDLPYFMGSLDKIKSDEKAIEKFKNTYSDSYMISDKLDGNSAMIQFKKGKAKLYSRGDGTVGQNITHLIPFIKTIPKIKDKEGDEITVRGELIISKADFEKVKNQGANARNMVAGIVNSKIPNLDIAKRVQFVAYELIEPRIEPEKQYEFMENNGFKTVYNKKIFESKLTLDKLSDILVKRRDESDFEIDGIVVFHNKIHKRVKETPSYAFAFKSVLTMQKAEVIVTNVEWNMSKDGYLIPVVEFNAVALAGVTIKRAHGFNGKYIKDNKIGPGSKIIIMRSGDVIPYITEIISESETGKGQMPDSKYTWTKTGVDIVLDINEQKDSDELRLKNLVHFFDKIDVKGLSEGNVKKIYAAGFKTAKAILNATANDLLKVDGFKSKMAEKIATAIQECKKDLDCVKVMNASNTLGRGFGSRKIELILSHIPKIITQRHIPSEAELLQLKGVEKITATQFIENLPKYFEFVDANDIDCMFEVYKSDNEIIEKKDSPKEISSASSSKVVKEDYNFNDQKIVFTGFRNEKLEKLIKGHGGSVSTSVSKNTSLVIRKDEEKESSKIKKAEELGIKIMALSDFLNKYKIEL